MTARVALATSALLTITAILAGLALHLAMSPP